MPSPLPPFQHLIALNNNAWDDPATISSVAEPPGVVGGPNQWTDISPWVRRTQIKRGRQHELARFEPGSCMLDLRNDGSEFNPWNFAGAFPGLFVGVPTRVQAILGSSAFPLFTGMMNMIRPLWPDNFSKPAQLGAADALRSMSQNYLTGSALGSYPPAVEADFPSNYWRLDEATGPSAADLGSSPRPGTYSGGTLGVTGPLTGQESLAFASGSTGAGHVTAANVPVPTGGAFSVEFWVKILTPPSPTGSPFAFNSGGPSGGINIQMVGAGGANVVVRVVAGDGHKTQEYQTLPTEPLPLADGNWHYVVATGTSLGTSGPLYTVWVDGAQHTTTQFFNNGPVTLSGTMTVTIPSGLDSAIAEVALYPTALNVAQVTGHFGAADNSSISLPTQLTGSRINYVLDNIGWPTGARHIDAGIIRLGTGGGTALTTKALAHMQQVELTEGGALFIDVGGRVRFIGHPQLTSPPYSTPQSLYGDLPGQLIYQPGVDLAEDDLDLFNIVNVQNVGGQVQSDRDSASVAKYGPRVLNLLTMLADSDSDAAARATYLSGVYSQPLVRLRRFTVKPLDDPARLVPEVCVRELMDCVAVTRTGIPGVPFGTVANIERIEHDITAEDWKVDYSISVALPAS